VKGLPLNLNSQVAQLLIKIVMEEEPVLLDEELVHPPIEMMNVFKNRKWGDSITSLLAAMYISLKRFPTTMSKQQICGVARRFCNHAIEDDYRNRRRGAWSSMNAELITKHSFVESRRIGPGFYCPVEFNLTRRGIQFCYALFTRKFHPTLRTCPQVITSPHATIREDGTVIPNGDHRPEEFHEEAFNDGFNVRQQDDLYDDGLVVGNYDDGVGWGQNLGEPKIGMDEAYGIGGPEYSNHSNGSNSDHHHQYIDPQEREMMRAIRVSRFEQLQKLNRAGKNLKFSNLKKESPVIPPLETKSILRAPQPIKQEDLGLEEDEQLSLAIALSLEASDSNHEYPEEHSSVIDICSQQSQHESETINICSQPDSPETNRKKRSRPEPCPIAHLETPLRKKNVGLEGPATPVISLLDDEDIQTQWNPNESLRKRKRVVEQSSATAVNVEPIEDDGYFDLSEIMVFESEKYQPASSFHVTTDPTSGTILDLTFSPSNSESEDDTRSISSEGSNPPSPLYPSKLSNSTRRRLSSSSQSSLALLKRRSIEVDLTEVPVRLTSPSSSPQEGCVCTVFVDRRERKDQANYRQFFLGIERQCKALFPDHHLLEQNLPIGDFLFMKGNNRRGLSDENKKDDQVRFNHVIERKTIPDIISRSLGEKRKHWGFEGAHIRQLRYMQYCGIGSSYILLEGSITGLAAAQGPLVRYTGQSGPDMITSSFDIMVFVTNMIACGWGKYRTHILQSNDEVKTALLLAAISYLFMHHPENASNSHPYSDINWQIKKEELSFHMDLQALDIDQEFAARVIRKFSTQKVLKEAYDIALQKSEQHALCLLDDLQPNISLSGRQTILTSEDDYEDSQDEDDFTLTSKKSCLQNAQSGMVLQLVCGNPTLPASNGSSHPQRKTSLWMNSSMKAILNLANGDNQSAAFADFIEIEVESDSSSSASQVLDVSWATGVVKVENSRIIRQSAPIQICVISGDALMEALVESQQKLENDHFLCPNSSSLDLFHHFYSVIDHAVTSCLQSMIPNMNFNTTSRSHSSGEHVQILIFDNFGPMSHNSGAFYRLQNELNKMQHESRFNSSSSTFSLRKDRHPLNSAAGRFIQLHFLKVVYPLLISYLNICQRCYVIESRNTKDCEKWLSFLFTSLHLHSLLLY
jgi:ERCC4-type nuclease